MKIKHINIVSLFFVLAISILAGLYFQLYTFNQQNKSYKTYAQNLTELTLTDIRVNAILQNQLSYVNFDLLNKELENCVFLLKELKNSPLNESLGVEITSLYQNLYNDLLKKHQLSEDYKSSNSSTLNSLHYLFDLNKKLQDDPKLSNQVKKSLESILYAIMNITLHLDLDYENIYQQIESLHDINSSNIYVSYYIDHARFALIKSKELSTTSKEIFSLPIQKELKHLNIAFHQGYDKKFFIQKSIVTLIFLLLFISAIMLFISHLRAEKTFLELFAFKSAVENSDNTVVMTDLDRNITYANEAFEKSTGYTVEQVMGSNPSMLKSGLMDDDFYKDLNETLDRGEKWTGEFINKKRDGSLYYEKASIVPIYIYKKLVSYLAIKLDITEYVQQRKKLQQSATVYEHTMDGIMITNAEGNIISINKALELMFGYSEEELLGENPRVLRSGQQDKAFYEEMWQTIIEKGHWKGKIFNRTKKGLLTQTWLSISSVKDANGTLINYIAIHTDVNELIMIQEKVDFMAHHDSLTNLPNRRFLEENLQQIINISIRDKQKFSVLFLDLDRFKIINDTLGHNVGDKLLKNVSQRIKRVLRKSDMLTRMGGDEFVIIAQNIKNDNEPAHISSKVLQSLLEPIEIDGHMLSVTASIGISIFPNDGTHISTLIKHADSAMYHAKDLGKNNFQYYTKQLSIDIHNRLHLEQALQHALTNKELYLHYQAQYDLQTRKIIAAEALLRWKNTELGYIPPDKFIPIAEETGLIISIGEFVFEEACKSFITWKTECLDIQRIAINVSSIQLSHSSFIPMVKKVINKTGILAKNIEIEITERYFYKYTSEEDNTLTALKDLGLSISIDDFGTGYSSMSYLKKLPLDIIKIDKSFIDDIPSDINDVEITKAIIALSSSLGYENIAEGIETKEQEEFLKKQKCAFGQGYLFQRPISSEEFIKFCRHCQTTKI